MKIDWIDGYCTEHWLLREEGRHNRRWRCTFVAELGADGAGAGLRSCTGSNGAGGVSFSAANISRFERGNAAEVWDHRDDLGLCEQVSGAILAGASHSGGRGVA